MVSRGEMTERDAYRTLAAYGRRSRMADPWSSFDPVERHLVMCESVRTKQSRAFMEPMSIEALKAMSIGQLRALWTEAHEREERITMRGTFDRTG